MSNRQGIDLILGLRVAPLWNTGINPMVQGGTLGFISGVVGGKFTVNWDDGEFCDDEFYSDELVVVDDRGELTVPLLDV